MAWDDKDLSPSERLSGIPALKRMSLARPRERYAQVIEEVTNSRHRGLEVCYLECKINHSSGRFSSLKEVINRKRGSRK